MVKAIRVHELSGLEVTLCIVGITSKQQRIQSDSTTMNTMEQLLAIQNAISQAEELIQDGNLVLRKLRCVVLSIYPQASGRFAIALVMMAAFVGFVPMQSVILLVLLEEFTKYSPVRISSIEKWGRRLREWGFSIPAAPVVLKKTEEDKKKKR